MFERGFWPLVTLLAALLAVVEVLSIRQEAQTWDEGFEIASGYQYLTTGHYYIGLDHPPLGRLLAALPLLYFRSALPALPLGQDVEGMPAAQLGEKFLYHASVPADTLLLAARLPMIAVTLAVVFVLAAWSRRKFGAPSALLAVVFFTLDPNVIANGRYVKNDLLLTLMTLLSVIAWEWFLDSRRIAALLASGAALGLAVASKFSGVFLIPVFLALYIIHERKTFSELRFAAVFLVTGAVAFLAVLAVYAPHTPALIPRHSTAAAALPPLSDAVDRTTPVGEAVAWIGTELGWRIHPFFVGITHFASHSVGGHESFLMGMYSHEGWWYYFPVAFALKTPVATLAALVLLIGLALSSVRLSRLGEPAFVWFLLLVPIVIYLAASMSGHVDIGVRHLLPVYTFLYTLLAAGLVHIRWRFQALANTIIVAGLAAESLAIYPYYLAFFNVLVGGPKNGPEYLVDSNIDWGQDIKRLGLYLAAHGNPSVCVCYFGTASTWYYLNRPQNLPTTDEIRRGEQVKCTTAAVSVTALNNTYSPRGSYSWLLVAPPVARVGWSIYVYDLADAKIEARVARLRASCVSCTPQ